MIYASAKILRFLIINRDWLWHYYGLTFNTIMDCFCSYFRFSQGLKVLSVIWSKKGILHWENHTFLPRNRLQWLGSWQPRVIVYYHEVACSISNRIKGIIYLKWSPHDYLFVSRFVYAHCPILCHIRSTVIGNSKKWVVWIRCYNCAL